MLDDLERETTIPTFKPSVKFRFKVGDALKIGHTAAHVYEIEGDYVTILVRKQLATAQLMNIMDVEHNVLYVGPMLDWVDGAHLTFKRKH